MELPEEALYACGASDERLPRKKARHRMQSDVRQLLGDRQRSSSMLGRLVTGDCSPGACGRAARMLTIAAPPLGWHVKLPRLRRTSTSRDITKRASSALRAKMEQPARADEMKMRVFTNHVK